MASPRRPVPDAPVLTEPAVRDGRRDRNMPILNLSAMRDVPRDFTAATNTRE